MEITDIKIYLDKFYKNVYLVIAGNYIITRSESRMELPINNNIYNEIKRKTYNYDDKIYRLSEYPKFIIDKYTGLTYTYIIFKMNVYDQSQIYNIVEGPIQIKELHNEELKSHIYLLGDLHTKHNCGGDIQIQDFIEKTVQYNKNKVIDIFLEVGYSFKAVGVPKRFKMESYITNVENKFYNCMYDRTRSSDIKEYNKSNNNCQYPNLRVHYADFRTIMPVNVDKYKLYYINILRNKLDKEKINLLIPLIQSSETNNMFNTIYRVYNINNKITKQYDNIENKDIVRKIFDYYRAYYDKSKYQKDRLLKLINNNIDNAKTGYLNFINKLFIKLTSPILDLYILGRLFRKYRNINNEYSDPAKNSFIYLGRKHIDHINKVLIKLGFIILNQTGLSDYVRKSLGSKYDLIRLVGDKSVQCLDITAFNQPFFSTNKFNQIIPRINIETIHINRQLIDIVKRIKPNDKMIIEVFNKINPTKLTIYDIDLFEQLYDNKLPSKELENIHTNYILSLSNIDQELFKLFVTGGHIDLNNFIVNGFKLDTIPSNLDIYYASYILYINQDIRLVNDPIKLQSYFLMFYDRIKNILLDAPKSDKLFTCYITNINQIDIYTDEFYNIDKYYFANINTLDIIENKTIMSISLDSNFIYYYGYIILPHFLNLKCLRSNINREFLDNNMNIVTRNYISYNAI